MHLNTSHFCALSSSPKFLAWLAGFSKPTYDELAEHARTSRSCRANTQKMLWVLEEIKKVPGWENSLSAMLSEHYPHVVADSKPAAQPKRKLGQGLASIGQVFEHYDPSLLTIPRRLVLGSEEEAVTFLAGVPVGEYVVVGGLAYVEYLPAELAHLLPQIPQNNWRVRVWRAANNLTQRQS